MAEERATFILDGDLSGGPRVLRRRQIWIGSDGACDIRLDEHFTISGKHARIEWDGENFHLTDADPANATFVNHRQAEFNEPVALAVGNVDVVQIGPYVLTLELNGATLRIEVSRLLVKSSFVIKRSDSAKKRDEVGWEHEVLLICNPPDQVAGGSPDGKLILNHPKVSPLHAGISRFKDRHEENKSRFYLIDLSPSNVTYLNKRLLRTDEPAALAGGEVAQIGPFDLTFTLDGEETLRVEVTLGVTGSSVAPAAPTLPAPATAPATVAADALRIFWAKRTREKAARRSPLQPSTPERIGKARYKWRATTDLARPWPLILLTWCALATGVVLVSLIALTGMSAFAPRPLSAAHASADFIAQPATARLPNANACTTCHARGRDMDGQCASCHQVEGVFVATVTPKHRAAGIGCADCHTEHRGASFRPGVAPMSADFQPDGDPAATCAGCHNDANDKLYNGRHVSTPHEGEHKGKFGYPVTPASEWIWPGLDQEELAQAAPQVKDKIAGWPNARQPLSTQFHALHVERVRAQEVGLPGDREGRLSCSSCHTSFGKRLDRETPRQTCGKCHNGRADAQTGRALIAPDQPDCASCHVQHVMDKRRQHPLLAAGGSGRP